jgi:hypothetical protein
MILNQQEIVQREPLTTTRVMEIYKEVNGREEQWVADTDSYRNMSEEELYAEFSNQRYIRRLGEIELATILKKPVLLSEDVVKNIYREIMSQELEYTDVYVRMTESEMREQLIKLKQTSENFKKFKQQWHSQIDQYLQQEDQNQ